MRLAEAKVYQLMGSLHLFKQIKTLRQNHHKVVSAGIYYYVLQTDLEKRGEKILGISCSRNYATDSKHYLGNKIIEQNSTYFQCNFFFTSTSLQTLNKRHHAHVYKPIRMSESAYVMILTLIKRAESFTTVEATGSRQIKILTALSWETISSIGR